MNNLNFHDAHDGPLLKCQITNNDDLIEVLDLGFQPLGDSLLTQEQLNMPETYYPLRLMRSKSLGHSQLDYIVPSSLVYHPEYPYKCGITKEVVDHHRYQASRTTNDLSIAKGSLVIDIGSNDGTLLNEFKKLGMRVMGVEPTNIAQIAISNGIDTTQSLFNQDTCKEIIKSHGKASLVTATNVFAHMSTMGEVIRGIKEVLSDDGYFVFENHYMIDILKYNQYDTIYHEHIRNYSLTSIISLFDLYNMKVIDAEIVERYNGSIRVVVSKNNSSNQSDNVKELLEYETKFGLFEEKVWKNFNENVHKSKSDLLNLLINLKKSGKKVVGNSCPCRASVLMNFCGIGKDLIPYIAEQPTSAKLGLFLPGKHIPIVNNQILFEEQPDYILLLAWHLATPIIKDLKSRGIKSKFIIPLPSVKVID